MFRLGCQTITWDKERTAKRDHTVRAVGAAGYEGVEIGAQFLDLEQPLQFKRVLDESGVRLIAIHIGWKSLAQIDGGEIGRAIAFAQVTGTPYLVMSGTKDEAQFAEGLPRLNAVGQRCRDVGMELCYHNHGWEILEDARMLRRIEQETDAQLVGFCPDIGWVRKVTPNINDVLNIIAPRIRAVHLKDYVADGLDAIDNETEFGEGILDFERVFAYLRQLPVTQLWVIAEQWKSSVNHLPPEECIARNRAFLQAVIESRS